MSKEIVKISTTGELELNVQRIECAVTDSNGKRQAQDEICLLVSGYNSGSNETVEEFVTLSLSEAKKLGTILMELSK